MIEGKDVLELGTTIGIWEVMRQLVTRFLDRNKVKNEIKGQQIMNFDATIKMLLNVQETISNNLTVAEGRNAEITKQLLSVTERLLAATNTIASLEENIELLEKENQILKDKVKELEALLDKSKINIQRRSENNK